MSVSLHNEQEQAGFEPWAVRWKSAALSLSHCTYLFTDYTYITYENVLNLFESIPFTGLRDSFVFKT